MKTYRIGVIGLGQRIAHVLAAMQEVGWRLEVAAQVDPAPVGAPILAAASIAEGRTFETPQALLAAGPYDLVMLGAPNHLHFEHLNLALDAGYPVFAEKPIVRTQAESLALASRLAGAGPPLFIGLVMRSMPIVRETIARVDAGELGEIVSIDATEHLPPEHGGYLARNWRRKAAWGGSYLLDKVCHDFDIFGRIARARPARVASFGGRRIFTAERAVSAPRTWDTGEAAYALRDAGWAGANDAFQSDMDVTDHQTAMVEYENQVRLSFHANSHVGLTERRWYVAGTEGTLIADLVRNKLMVRRALSRAKPERIDYANRTEDAHNGADQAMARDLLATLSEGAPFPVTPFDSLEAGLTVMAIDEAMESGEVLDCRPMWARYDAAISSASPSRS